MFWRTRSERQVFSGAHLLLLEYQLYQNHFFRLRFQRVYQPHPTHGVTGFQFLDDARRLHHAGQHGVHALRCGLVKAGGGIKIPHRLFLPLYSGQVIGPCPAGAPVSSARAGYCPIHGGGQRLRSGQSLPPSFPGKTARKCLYAIK